jgi:hypothetical protein
VAAGQISASIRGLILEMSMANPLWGAPRIHGELLKLGINVGQTLRKIRILGCEKASNQSPIDRFAGWVSHF